MECACISAPIDEEAEFVKRKKITARKKHKCCECRAEIQPGQEYWLESSAFEGKIDVFKTCIDCKSVRDYLMCDWWYGLIWQTIEDFIRDYPDKISYTKISRLTPKAQEKVCGIIEQMWEEEKEYT